MGLVHCCFYVIPWPCQTGQTVDNVIKMSQANSILLSCCTHWYIFMNSWIHINGCTGILAVKQVLFQWLAWCLAASLEFNEQG